MKICKVYIKGFQQFEDLELDFTNPKTGEPLDKICFIGRNGTGKSTILRILNQIIHNIGNYRPSYFLLVKVKIQNNFFYLVNLNRENFKEVLIYHSDIEKENKYWIEDMKLFADQKIGQLELDKYLKYLLNPEERKNLYSSVALKRDSSDLLVFSPAETSHNNYLRIQDVPPRRD
jgi:ATPase subunit of ABC transporter with duplicated ATPase domains